MRAIASARVSGFSRALAVAVASVASIDTGVLAQTGPIQRGVETQIDSTYEAARRWFEALPEAERRDIQDALIWTGDYKGTTDGGFGKRTREAIAAFAARLKKPADGTLDGAAKAALLAAAEKARAAVRFGLVTDKRSGARIGMPQKLMTKVRPAAAGTLWEAPDGSAALSTDISSETELSALYGRVLAGLPGGRATYKVLRPDFLVVAGEEAGRTIYTRYARGLINGQPVLRGFTLSYASTAKATFEPIALAIANSFDPFPAATAVAAAPAAPNGGAAALQSQPAPIPPAAAPSPGAAPPASWTATGVVIRSGLVLTSYSACPAPLVNGRPAGVSKRDEASGSALLEVSGLNITPYAHVSGGREGAPVLVLAFSSDRVLPAGGAAPAADLQISSGQLRQATGGIRVAAALQQPGAGAAVVSRAGDLIGFAMLRADTAPRLVAGVVPESTYPITLVDALAAADAAGSRPSEKTAGEILASVGAALVRVTCPSAP